MRYFMHDPTSTLYQVEDIRQMTVLDDMEEISLGLFNQLKEGDWNVEVIKGRESTPQSTVEGDDVFAAFINDPEAWDMYVTGPAGTGKTTMAADFINRCAAAGIDVIVSAYTHKACGVLASKLPSTAKVQTLHSFLSKRPLINTEAKQAAHVTTSKVCGAGGTTQLLIVDEYGMVGEKDLLDLRALQDPNYSATPVFKVLWLGDPNQLPPVRDMQAVKPQGPYQVRLTTVHRTSNAPLLDVLARLVTYIEGTAEPEPIDSNEYFVRGQDIISCEADIILAYTNARVQELNALKQGYSAPLPGDLVFCATNHATYEFMYELNKPDAIWRPYQGMLGLDSKYKTLEYLHEHSNCSYAMLRNVETGEEVTVAYIFGHSDYNKTAAQFKEAAAEANLAISKETGANATAWAKANPQTKLARRRAKAWRDFLTFDECVVCLDFDHARTVHKAQGSTFNVVAVDMDDLYKCAERDFKMYLRLLYVAVSRAAVKVITN